MALASRQFAEPAPRTGYRPSVYDPLSIVSVNSGLSTFLTVVAVPFRNSFFFVVLAIVAALASWTTLLSAPTMLCLLLQLWRWSRARNGPLNSHACLCVLMCTTAVHVLLVYALQIPGLRQGKVIWFVKYFNVPILADTDTREMLVLEIIHMTAVHMFFVALACHRSTLDETVVRRVNVQDIVHCVHQQVYFLHLSQDKD